MSEGLGERIRQYVLDGSDRDLRRLLLIADVQAESARAAVGRIGDIAGWRVVECGCGPLGSLAVLSELVGSGGTVTGIDFNAAAVERARSVLTALGVDNVDVLAAEVHDIDPRAVGAPFDLGYTRAFLMHQADPGVTLARIARLLRPGGWLIAQEPLRVPPPRSHPAVDALDRYWELMHEAAARSGVARDAVETLPAAARRAGFDVVHVSGFFNVVDPAVGFEIHASAVSAIRSRVTATGVADDFELARLEESMREHAAGADGWVTTPFMLDLALRRS
jgi:SAM-dependent methyltransferase